MDPAYETLCFLYFLKVRTMDSVQKLSDSESPKVFRSVADPTNNHFNSSRTTV
jgi:hypothetical protein